MRNASRVLVLAVLGGAAGPDMKPWGWIIAAIVAVPLVLFIVGCGVWIWTIPELSTGLDEIADDVAEKLATAYPTLFPATPTPAPLPSPVP
jgi:hypothetical protein